MKSNNEAGKEPLPDGPLERLLTEPQAAELLTLSTRTLQTYRENGSGPKFLKFGRRIAYEPKSLRAWLDARARRSTCDSGCAA